MIRILLADDHTLVRSGLKILLNQVEHFDIVGEAGNGEEAIELIKKQIPDLVLLDINMPKMDGFDTVTHIKKINSNIKILMLTMYSDQESLVKAIELGANGYILKKAPEEELIMGIKQVINEGSYVDRSLTQTFVHAMVKKQNTTNEIKKERKALTTREKEVLKLVAQGATDKEIADELVISIKTVEAHKHKIKEKLQVKRLAELIRYSLESGLLDE
ncbi:hypothetical protein BKP35_08555 [Anaerobacillus arseniciselenatis]|uniref:DNA-binding response regulator n=1 Tax=Anaerobacillus arseniciselenatis TaxID=85682 RepID=A0A1S2LMQ9_9BACI|nr:response regulator transcription factor [Anaerobacillus arseniciselenatis]OIJ13818.1 hypothetical protein BKP35_08555 [Anaerobacillus arseniciselenatis]